MLLLGIRMLSIGRNISNFSDENFSAMKLNPKKSILLIFILFSLSYGGTRVAYTRPGLMMKIPTSSNKKAPYLFRTGFGTEVHNFNPFNTAKGVYFDMEFGKGFTAGFSAVQGGDTTSRSTFPLALGSLLLSSLFPSYSDLDYKIDIIPNKEIIPCI